MVLWGLAEAVLSSSVLDADVAIARVKYGTDWMPNGGVDLIRNAVALMALLGTAEMDAAWGHAPGSVAHWLGGPQLRDLCKETAKRVDELFLVPGIDAKDYTKGAQALCSTSPLCVATVLCWPAADSHRSRRVIS